MTDDYPTEITVAEFAAATPSVPAERLACRECDGEYIGDPNKLVLCPACKRANGIPVGAGY